MSAPAARTPVWIACGAFSYEVALGVVAAGHAPTVHLLGLTVDSPSAAIQAANWLKVSGLQQVPVYGPKDTSKDEAKQTEAESFLVGARFPPIAAGSIHHELVGPAMREAATKQQAPLTVIVLDGSAPAAPTSDDGASDASVVGQWILAADIQLAKEIGTKEALVDQVTAFASPYSALVLDLLSSASFSWSTLARLVTAIGSAQPDVAVAALLPPALVVANEKSHLNRARKSKAPAQKQAKPGQIVHAATSSNGVETASYPPPGPLPPATPLDPLPADSPLHSLQADVSQHVRCMLVDSLMYSASKGEHLFVLYDQNNELTRLLARAYRRFIDDHQLTAAQATFLNFHDDTPDAILARLWSLKAHDSVILIQSQQFRLSDYRIRLELFKRSIRSIEHVHLEIIAPAEYAPYVAALAFSPKEYGALAYTLKDIVDRAEEIVVESRDGSRCVYSAGMQECKLNIGDYRHMAQVGGTYPIGEVFSESKQLAGVNGRMTLFGYPSLAKQLVLVDPPIRIEFREGVLQFDPTADPPILPEHATPEFLDLLGLIRSGEGEISLREFGMGLNRGMSRERTVADIFAFERQHGLHISLGKKHNVFKADGIKGKQTTFHIDVFVDCKTITCDGVKLFDNDEWTSERRFDFQGNPLQPAGGDANSNASAESAK